MDPASALPLAEEGATNPTPPMSGESKADPAIGSPLDSSLTPSPDRGRRCSSPCEGGGREGVACGPNEGPVCKFALKFARKPLDI